MKNSVYILLLLTMISSSLCTAQWRGDNRSGHFSESNLLKEWPEAGPNKLLEASGLGDGWSSAVVGGDLIFTTGKKDSLDYLTAVNYQGAIVWQVPIGKAWANSFPDARNTPSVDGQKVYALSGEGQLGCYNMQNGERDWWVNVDSIYKSEWPMFGVAEAPLIIDDLVVVTPGGDKSSMVAYNKNSGEQVWATVSVGGMRSYMAPVVYENNSVRHIIGATSKMFFAVNPVNGEVQWTFDYETVTKEMVGKEFWGSAATNSPLIKGDEVFITSGYNYPAFMLKVGEDGKSVKVKWISRTLDCHHHGVVELDGYIYGTNWYNNRKGNWVCLDWDSGEVKFVHHWFEKGVIVEADGMFYVMDENKGNVGLLQPDKDEFQMVSTFSLEGGKGKYWAHPTIFDSKLFLRHGDVLQVFDVALPVQSASQK